MTTTTLYPTLEGNLYSTNATYSTARTGSGVTEQATTSGTNRITTGQLLSGNPFIWQAFMKFDTSSIPDTDVITSVTFSLYLDTDASTTDFTANLRVYNFGSDVEVADWVDYNNVEAIGPVVASINSSGIGATGEYKNWTSTSAMLGQINKSSTTSFILTTTRAEGGSGNSPPNSEYLNWTGYGYVDNTRKPKLVITHAPRTKFAFTVNGRAEWRPNNAPGLLAWYDAANLPASSGLSALSDRSGNGYNLIQPTGTKQPDVVENALNGRSVIRFDVANEQYLYRDSLTDLGFDYTSPKTIAAVVVVSDAGATGDYVVCGKCKPSSPYTGWELFVYSAKMSMADMSDYPTDQVRIFGSTNIHNNPSALVLTTTGSATAAGATLYLDNVAETKTVNTDNLTATTIETATSKFTLGGRFGQDASSISWNGDIAEVCIWDNVISAGDRTFLDTYFSNRWGV